MLNNSNTRYLSDHVFLSNCAFLITYHFNIKKAMNTMSDFLICAIADATVNRF